MTRRLDRHLDARQRVDRAENALNANMPLLALEQVRDVLDENPGDLKARLIEARAKLALCRPDDALCALETAFLYSQGSGPRPDLDAMRAEALMQCDLDDLAQTQIEHLRRRFPDDVRCHRLAVELAMKQHRHDDARTALRDVLRLEPSDQSARRLLARLTAQDDPDAAIEQFARDEADTARRLELARLCRRVDRLADADAHYTAVLGEHTDDAALWVEAGELSLLIGNDEVAVRRLTHAANISDAEDNTALHALAVTHMQAGRFAVAGRCWWRAARRYDTDVRAWAGLMLCTHACDRTKAARRAAGKLDRYASKSERRVILADLWRHAAAGHVIARTAAADEASNPHDHPGAFDRLLTRAADVLREHVAEHPRRADMHYHRAVCLNALGRGDEAEPHIDEALAINPAYKAAQRLAA